MRASICVKRRLDARRGDLRPRAMRPMREATRRLRSRLARARRRIERVSEALQVSCDALSKLATKRVDDESGAERDGSDGGEQLQAGCGLDGRHRGEDDVESHQDRADAEPHLETC